MFLYKSISKYELKKIIRNAAQVLGINEVILEKDYWVCFVLNYLFNICKWKNDFTFKGGTSLSKCFHLIERFSEDIDLILDWRTIGYNFEEPWLPRSNTQQQKFIKECNKKTEDFLKNVFIPQMQVDFKEIINDTFSIKIDEKDAQTVLFEYPKSFDSSYINQTVRLEIGTLAAWTPSENVKIVPDIKNIYPMLFEGQSFAVRTVLPERTFWEKATILHHEANRPRNSLISNRYARHYYDLYCMSNSIYKTSAFEKIELLDKVVKFKMKFYPRGWAKYEDANIKSIKLVPEHYRFKEIKADYENMHEMFFGNYPSFDELMNRIDELENEIHNIRRNN